MRNMHSSLARARGVAFLGAWSALAFLAAACGSLEPQTTAESGATWEEVRTATERAEVVVVLTVDPSAEADTLRAELGDALEGTFGQLLERAAPALDPAAWRHVDWSIWVTRPGAVGSDRWLTPISLRTDRPTEAQIADLAATVVERLNALTTGTAPYRPMRVTHDAVTLLTGERAPEDAREQELLASLGANDDPLQARRLVSAVVVSARDDEGTTQPDGFAIAWSEERPAVLSVVVPSAETSCVGGDFPADAGLPRLFAWQDASDAVAYGWPCARDDFQRGGLSAATGGTNFCPSRPLLAEPEGDVLCRAWVELLPDGIACADYGRGWIEPGPEAPATADCEIPQLEGAALEACRRDVDCEGCGDGFCQAEATTWREIHPQEHCAGVPARLRFVGGAFASQVRVRCALE